MTAARIQELASAIGVQPAKPLPANEIVSFRLRRNGGVTTVTAGGEVLRCACSDDLTDNLPAKDVAAHRAGMASMLAMMVRLVPGGVIAAGVTYVRRRIATGDGTYAEIFSEAGR